MSDTGGGHQCPRVQEGIDKRLSFEILLLFEKWFNMRSINLIDTNGISVQGNGLNYLLLN